MMLDVWYFDISKLSRLKAKMKARQKRYGIIKGPSRAFPLEDPEEARKDYELEKSFSEVSDKLDGLYRIVNRLEKQWEEQTNKI